MPSLLDKDIDAEQAKYGAALVKLRQTLPPRLGQRKIAFLRQLRRVGQVTKACSAVGIKGGWTTVSRWLLADKEFAAIYEYIRWVLDRESREKLHEAMTDRAINGWDEPVFHEGFECGTKRKYDTRLQVHMAQVLDPDKHGKPGSSRDSSTTVNIDNRRQELSVQMEGLSIEELRAIDEAGKILERQSSTIPQ